MFTEITFGVAIVAAIIIPNIVGGWPMRFVVWPLLGGAAVYTGFLSLVTGLFITVMPLFIFLVEQFYYYWLGKRALAGTMGKEKQWIAQLIQEDDHEFKQAFRLVEPMRTKEIIIMADSKDELRELVVDEAYDDQS